MSQILTCICKAPGNLVKRQVLIQLEVRSENLNFLASFNVISVLVSMKTMFGSEKLWTYSLLEVAFQMRKNKLSVFPRK
jgi:hypothetical protein